MSKPAFYENVCNAIRIQKRKRNGESIVWPAGLGLQKPTTVLPVSYISHSERHGESMCLASRFATARAVDSVTRRICCNMEGAAVTVTTSGVVTGKVRGQ